MSLINCHQCGGSGKSFFRTGKYIDCDMCEGKGVCEDNTLWISQGKLMYEWRIGQNITLREASRKFEIDVVILSKMERGIIKPDPEYLKRILCMN